MLMLILATSKHMIRTKSRDTIEARAIPTGHDLKSKTLGTTS